MTEERVKRKLSAILSADVVGYSRLMGEDEVSTVRTLEAYRKVMSDLIEQFRGRVVDSPGDNLLAEFGSVVDAVQCAVEIHEVIRAKNEELPEDRRMLFRIGVNLGDVIEEGDRIYGDGVNIASRLEGLAEAGGICISGSAHEQIENKLALGYEYLGEHTVKNITKPVKAYRVPLGPKSATPKEDSEKKTKSKKWQWTALGAVGAIIVIFAALTIWYFSFSQAPIATDVEEAPKTIAVLPFDDISPDKDQEYFADGLTEEILNYISNISGLHVTSKTSSFAFKNTDKTIKEIAGILEREYILEGSVRKVGNSLRITTQLIHVADDRHLWSETYDRELKDIFKIQEDIANNVADKLKLTLEAFNLLGGTKNIDAYEKYLVGRGKYAESDTQSALELLDAAIDMDPEFALAWAYKGHIHMLETFSGSPTKSIVESEACIEAAQKAIELEPNLADGYITLGSMKMLRSEWLEAEINFRKALELYGESLSGNHSMIIPYYVSVGKFKKAHELLEKIRKNDPLDQNFLAWYYFIYGLLGNRERADEEYQNRNQTMLKGDSDWHDNAISFVRIGSGDVLSSDEIVSSDPIYDTLKKYPKSSKLGLDELRRIYNSDNKLSSSSLSRLSIMAAYFGAPELSLDALKKGARISSDLVPCWVPVMTKVRQLPRFKEFMREIGLVDYWKEYGWPDLCHPVGDDDFECD